MRSASCEALPRYLRKCINDALKAFNKEVPQHPSPGMVYPNVLQRDLDIYMWPQLWGSTTCGYSGIGGRAMTTSYIVVIHYQGFGYRIYNNCFAFALKKPNDKFVRDFENRKIHMKGQEYESS